MITDEQIKTYWDSLTEDQKFKAFSRLASWSVDIDELNYSEELNSIYWTACGEDLVKDD